MYWLFANNLNKTNCGITPRITGMSYVYMIHFVQHSRVVTQDGSLIHWEVVEKNEKNDLRVVYQAR